MVCVLSWSACGELGSKNTFWDLSRLPRGAEIVDKSSINKIQKKRFHDFFDFFHDFSWFFGILPAGLTPPGSRMQNNQNVTFSLNLLGLFRRRYLGRQREFEKFLVPRNVRIICAFDSARLEASKTKLDFRKLKMSKNVTFSLAMWNGRNQVSEITLKWVVDLSARRLY